MASAAADAELLETLHAELEAAAGAAAAPTDGFAAAAERTQAQLGEQIVRSLLHGEPELGAGVGC